MDVSAPVDIGSDFLGYRIEELLGRGGMGVVYRAYDLRLKRPVALKLVVPSLAEDERFRERFARETELLMSLEHPNVVPIHDAGDFEGRVYLAMRLVDGTDLGSLLRTEGALEPARALAICSQIAAALDAAHARGLVHRDVKPSNVLLDSSEHVYLADFGLTRRLDDDGRVTADDFAGGTPAYLAPEQLDGSPVDGSADTYALGCMLYECLTGEPVFPRASRLAVAWAHLEEEPPKPSKRRAELPQALDAVVERALAKDPKQRYPTGGALVEAAGQALGLGPKRTSRRRRTLLLAGAAAVAVAAGVIATLLAQGSGKAAPHLYAGQNTLARIDPAARKVEAVVPVGVNPVVSAGSGHHIWVFSEGNGRVTELDTRSARRIEKPIVSPLPPAKCCRLYSGPVLAADKSGAWLVQGGYIGKPQLVHLPVGRHPAHPYPLPITPTGVATGTGAVWVVGMGQHDDEVLRVDPADGRVTASRSFPASAQIDSIAYGYGYLWVVSSAKSTLYRLDPQLLQPPERLGLPGSRATRAEMIRPYVWVQVEGHDETFLIRPDPLKKVTWVFNGPPTAEENVWGLGARWWYDSPTGTVGQQPEQNGPTHTIRVTHKLPGQGGPCLSSIATVDGSVWVTVAPLADEGGAFICQR